MVVPGVYDVLSAKLAERAGFPTAVLTGYGFAAAHLGEPDFGLFTQSEILDCARRITAAVQIGIVVDGDTEHRLLDPIVSVVSDAGNEGLACDEHCPLPPQVVIETNAQDLSVHGAPALLAPHRLTAGLKALQFLIIIFFNLGSTTDTDDILLVIIISK